MIEFSLLPVAKLNMQTSKIAHKERKKISYWFGGNLFSETATILIYVEKNNTSQVCSQLEEMLSKLFLISSYQICYHCRKTLFSVELSNDQVDLFIHAIVANLSEAEIGKITVNKSR